MRPDMNKVVTERERGGSSNPNEDVRKNRREKQHMRTRLQKTEDGWELEHSPNHLGMGMSNTWDAKEFTDVLNPLKGWLRSVTGKPWDDSYSEACKILDRRSVSGAHVFEHLRHYIRDNVELRDGTPYYLSPSRGGQGGWAQLFSSSRFPQFYLEHGLLREAPRALPRRKPSPNPTIKLDSLRYIAQHKNGLWFEVWGRPVHRESMERNNTEDSFPLLHALDYCHWQWRQLNKKELKQYKLRG